MMNFVYMLQKNNTRETLMTCYIMIPPKKLHDGRIYIRTSVHGISLHGDMIYKQHNIYR